VCLSSLPRFLPQWHMRTTFLSLPANRAGALFHRGGLLGLFQIKHHCIVHTKGRLGKDWAHWTGRNGRGTGVHSASRKSWHRFCGIAAMNLGWDGTRLKYLTVPTCTNLPRIIVSSRRLHIGDASALKTLKYERRLDQEAFEP
jgi:hypothetical protein